MLARRFLWIVAGLIVLVLAGALAYRLFEPWLFRTAMVPTVAFEESAVPMPPRGPTYADAALWIARPDIDGNPALWLPSGFESAPAVQPSSGDQATKTPDPLPKAAIFFIHPTSFLNRSRWNAPIDDEESQQRARCSCATRRASSTALGEVWAPKYRQATFGRLPDHERGSLKALDFAYATC
jgi:hypothetical protein